MKKRIKKITFLLIVLSVCIPLCGCNTRVFLPKIKIKTESVNSLIFQKIASENDQIICNEKVVTEPEDIEGISRWMESLDISKRNDAILMELEEIRYIIVLTGAKDHRLIFLEDCLVYDKIAYDILDKNLIDQFQEKYNLLNYAQNPAEVNWS